MTAPGSVRELAARVRAADLGPDPAALRVSAAFTTTQAVRHDGRTRGYRNEVLSLRLGSAVGSCATEPGEADPGTLDTCVGSTVRQLLDADTAAVRTAALDAYLMHALPHTEANGARPCPIPAGSSLDRSRARARVVIDLLGPAPGGPVLVVGVVNSLLEALRERGTAYVPCDLKGGRTEWGEPVRTDMSAELDRCDAVLASGMTLGNGTFGPLLAHARATGKPLVMFAQTGSAVLPRFVGAGVTAVCAEPYPFFWLDGGPGVVHAYGGAG